MRVDAAAGLGAVGLAALALAAPAAAATAHPGDWEATGPHNAAASFQVSRSGRAITDLVVQAPNSCSNAFSTPLPVDVEVISKTLELTQKGSFSTGSIGKHGGTAISGTLRGRTIAFTYRHVTREINAYEGGTEVCDTGRIHLTARPGHRKTPADGVWEGQTAESEPVELNVVAGGRALLSPDGLGPGGTKFYAFEVAGTSSTDTCGYQISYPILLSPNGSFSNQLTQLGDEASVSGAFSAARRGSGKFSNPEESCSQESWSVSWDLAKP